VVALAISWVTGRLEATAATRCAVTPTLSWDAWQRVPAEARKLRSADVIAYEPSVPLYIQSGQTLGGILENLGLGPAEAGDIVGVLAEFADLRKLRPVDQYAVNFGEGRAIESFELVLAGRGRARVAPGKNGWEGTWHAFERTLHSAVVEGRLETSLERAIDEGGGPPSLSIYMADVFQWDLDFTRDLRRGDTFRVAFEKEYLDGVYNGISGIVAMTYDNNGRRLEAYRFGPEDQYYDAEGRPMRKMFLRSPLRYSRVTSRFTRSRFHPILKKYRPHYGVDYGAPTGTPVRVTANGTVTFAGWDRGGGKTVKVRHPNSFLTAYLHLSRFASGIRSGKRVAQGDVIGYVGSTGLSTGPHLDYRVQKNGRWIDPLSLRSVPADPVPTDRLAEFIAWRDQLRERLSGEFPASEDMVIAAALTVDEHAGTSAGAVSGR
jgi:murein DD-endopeptidase MepM/ murein hydrolase activator NlpD